MEYHKNYFYSRKSRALAQWCKNYSLLFPRVRIGMIEKIRVNGKIAPIMVNSNPDILDFKTMTTLFGLKT